jgi:signal transduction histidine kinase
LEKPAGAQTYGAHAEAEAADTLVGDTRRVSIAHDLNNLLTPVIWMLVTLQEKQVGSPTHHQRIEGAIACADRARSLVRQLAETSASQQQLDLTSVHIQETLADLEKVFLCALGPRIRLVFDIEPALSVVRVDREQIERTLLNLIVNARDAMPHGGTVTVGARMETRSTGQAPRADKMLNISIRDTGTGMDAATLRQSARPFFSTKPGGSGLGLAVARDLLERLNGDMTITSKLGFGTTIDMWLPVAVPSD